MSPHSRLRSQQGRLLLLCIVTILALLAGYPSQVLAGEPEELKPPRPPQAAKSDSRGRDEILTYTVQAGDTVYGLAKEFGLKPETIIWANEALMGRPDRLRVGQPLRILPVDGLYYVIRSGDTLSALARRFGVSVQEIVRCRYNHIKDRNRLSIGMALIIPGAQGGGSVPRRLHYHSRPPADASPGTGTYVWPTQGLITQRFHRGHPALDIGAPKGTPVRAVDSGFVVETAWSDFGYGHCIVIDHGNGVRTRYAHLLAYHVSAGESVTQGQIIGEVGASGRATGPHLHLEIIVNGVHQDPLTLLPAR